METIVRIQRAIDYTEEHILDRLTFEDIAREAHMSSQQFQRLFSILCGISLGEYIRNRRLSLAAEERKATKAKIIEIAFRYGYENPESFSRAFSRFHHITPAMARKHGETKTFAKITIHTILEGMNLMLERMKQRGYMVGNVGTVYLTADMEKTAEWFEQALKREMPQATPYMGAPCLLTESWCILASRRLTGFFCCPGNRPPA